MPAMTRHHWQANNVLDAFRKLTVNPSPSLPLLFLRPASHASQGTANARSKNGPGKRLGAKRSGGEKVRRADIIYRQRGTIWFPGDNCGMGRDHTIYSKLEGYVRYYKDPKRHPDRQYIGVVLEPHMKLPIASHLTRRRRLGLDAVEMEAPSAALETDGQPDSDVASGVAVVTGAPLGPASASQKTFMIPDRLKRGDPLRVQLRPGYQYRETNWEIGRTMERLNIEGDSFKPGDRFKAWRIRVRNKKKALQSKASSKKKKGAKK